MTFEQMVKDLIKPGKDILSTLTPEKCHLLHCALGIGGEGAEVLACMDNSLFCKKFDRTNAIEELGDLEFYLEALPEEYKSRVSRFSDNQQKQQWGAETARAMSIICVESGVLMDLIKKVVIYDKQGASDDIKQAVYDVYVSMDLFYSYTGITKQNAIDANMVKLLTGKNARYKQGTYTNQQAQDRNDKR